MGVHASCEVAAASTGIIPRSRIATLIVRKWILRTREYWMLDWGSRIPLVWESGGKRNRFREYTKPHADRPIQQLSRYLPFILLTY